MSYRTYAEPPATAAEAAKRRIERLLARRRERHTRCRLCHGVIDPNVGQDVCDVCADQSFHNIEIHRIQEAQYNDNSI